MEIFVQIGCSDPPYQAWHLSVVTVCIFPRSVHGGILSVVPIPNLSHPRRTEIHPPVSHLSQLGRLILRKLPSLAVLWDKLTALFESWQLQKARSGRSKLKRLQVNLCFVASENAWRCHLSTGHLLPCQFQSLLSNNKQKIGVRTVCPGEAVGQMCCTAGEE